MVLFQKVDESQSKKLHNALSNAVVSGHRLVQSLENHRPKNIGVQGKCNLSITLDSGFHAYSFQAAFTATEKYTFLLNDRT